MYQERKKKKLEREYFEMKRRPHNKSFGAAQMAVSSD